MLWFEKKIILLLYILRGKFAYLFLAKKNSRNNTLLAKNTYAIFVLKLHLPI